MPRYVLDILVRGTDRATGPLSRVRGALGRILQIASGILIAGAIRFVTDQLSDLAGAAIESYTNLELMQVGLESLVAREIARGEIVQTTSQVVRQLTDDEILQLDKLTLKYHELNTELGDLEGAYSDAIGEFGEDSMEALALSIAIRETKNELAETEGQMTSLANAQGALVTITKEHREGTMSLRDALELAKGPAQRLTDWVVRLSLQSPFTEQSIQTVLRLGAGYGFVTQHAAELMDEQKQLEAAQEDGVVTAQRFALAMVEFTAALGLPPEDLERLARAIAQVQAKGFLRGEEIRQLTNAGVGFDLMALAMGMTVKEFQALQAEGKILAEDFIPALITLIEDDLTGSALRLTLTLGGVKTNLTTLRGVILREFFGPTFRMLTPKLVALYQELSSEEFLAGVAIKGREFADWLSESYRSAQNLYNVLKDISDLHLGDFAMEWIIETVEGSEWADWADDVHEAALAWNELYDEMKNANPELGFAAGNAEAADGAVTGLTTALGLTGLIGLLKGPGSKVLGTIGGLLLFIGKRIGWLGLAAAIFGAIWEGDWLGIRTTITTAWEEDIQPALSNLWDELQVEGPKAIDKFKTWWNDDFLTALEEGWGWLSIDMPEAFNEFKLSLGEELGTAITTASSWLKDDLAPAIEDHVLPAIEELVKYWGNQAKTVFEEIATIVDPNQSTGATHGFKRWAEILTDDLLPALGELRDDYLAIILPDLKEFALTVGGAIIGALLSLWATVIMWINPMLEAMREAWSKIHPLLKDIDEFLGNILEISIGLFGIVWTLLIKPALEKLSELLGPISELVAELVGLFGDILEIFADVTMGWIVNVFIPALGDWAEDLREDLNPMLQWTRDLLENWEEILGESRLGRVVLWFMDSVLGVFSSMVEDLAGFIDDLTEAIRNLRGVLEGMELPDWAHRDSPSPVEKTFMGWADALTEVNKQLHGSGIRSLKNMNFMSAFMNQQHAAFAMAGTGVPTTVVFEGDENTYHVPDESTGRLVSHLVVEEKKKQFAEYMGRK